MRHIFIINPLAGKGKSLELIPFIENQFKNTEDECIIEITKYPGHAAKIAAEYSQKEECRIYSVGGDGTLNEIINGVAGSTSSIGIIPTGSGNDFVRSIESNSEIKDTIIKTINGTERRIDLARVNDRFFVNISSIGFDAEVVYNADKFKKVPGVTGSMAYLFSIIYSVLKKKVCNVKINIDGTAMELKVLLAAIANGRYYGGGMLPVPDAVLDDGMLDVCVVTEVTRLTILGLFPRYMKGLHGDMKQVSFFKGKNIKIESEEELCLNIDGEILKSKSMEFEVLEGAVKVIYPASQIKKIDNYNNNKAVNY